MGVFRADMFVPIEAPVWLSKGRMLPIYLHEKGYSSMYIGDSNGSSCA